MKVPTWIFRNISFCLMLILFFTNNVSACDCPIIGHINHYQLYGYEKVEWIEIVEKKYISDSIVEISYQVKEHFFPENQEDESGKIRQKINRTSCEINFQKGENWLLYFDKEEHTDEFYISYCGHSRKLDSPSGESAEFNFLRNFNSLTDHSICPDLNLVDEGPSLNLLKQRLSEFRTTIECTETLFLTITINRNGEVKDASFYKNPSRLDQIALLEILKKVKSIKGLKPATIKNYKVNVSMIVSL